MFVPEATQNHSLVPLLVLFSVAEKKNKKLQKLEQGPSRGLGLDRLS